MPDEFDLPQTGNADLPARAAKAAGWGFLALVAVVGGILWLRRK
ncbi:MAG TPA: hypothetical protein VK163_01265 [Opitutaceae bacterium]|nr:hypothetical protein [Opitutaceae bacterium]